MAPALAKEGGAALVIINPGQTGLDRLAELVVKAVIGPALDDGIQSNVS